MLAFILFIVLLCVIVGIVGAVVHGLFYLIIIAAVVFVATLVLGGGRLRSGRNR